MRFLLVFCFWGILPSALFAQNKKLNPLFEDSIRNIEYQLEGLSYNIINSKDVQERRTSNYYFVQTLKKALEVPGSYNYDFKSFKTISVLRSPDDKFRVFTWNLIEDSGRYQYFGAIQMNNKDSLILFGLYDSSRIVRDPLYSTLDNRHWMGVLYYQIHPYKFKKQDYYVLFGWNGMDAKTNRKIIDVLWFDDFDKPQFGAEIFDYGEDLQSRVIFDFSENAVLLCRFDKSEDKIVFANLQPINPLQKGKFENYIPDGSYDYFVLEKGIWRRKSMLFSDRKQNSNLYRRE